jgi:predicted kinase
MAQLIVFTGLPGTGKSSLAEMSGRELGIPVFAKDWLEASLVRVGITAGSEKLMGYAGYELLTTLAERQLHLGQSAILDSVASFSWIRERWRQIVATNQAQWRVIECVCSDEALHRARLERRRRNIPNWSELTWADVQRVKSYYQPWTEDRLIIDTVAPMEQNFPLVRAYLNT